MCNQRQAPSTPMSSAYARMSGIVDLPQDVVDLALQSTWVWTAAVVYSVRLRDTAMKAFSTNGLQLLKICRKLRTGNHSRS